MLYINFPPGYWNLSLKSWFVLDLGSYSHIYWTLNFSIQLNWTLSLEPERKWAFVLTAYTKIKEKRRGLVVCLWTLSLPLSTITQTQDKIWLSTEPHLILYTLIISCTLFRLAIKNSSSNFWLYAWMLFRNKYQQHNYIKESS